MRQPVLIPLASLPEERAVTRPLRIAPVQARRILAGGALCGITGDLAFRAEPSGIGLTLYIAMFAVGIGGLSWSTIKALPLRVSSLLAAGLGFAVLLLFRNSELLTFANTMAALVFITLASALAKPGETLSLTNARVRDLLGLVPSGVVETATGAPRFLLGDVRAAFLGADGTSRSRLYIAVARAGVIALTLTLVFYLLLSGADPVFRSMVAWPESWTLFDLPNHLVRFGMLAWPVLGLMWSTTRPVPATREDPLTHVLTLNRLDVVTALGAMNALFGLYLLMQIRVLFGGSQYVLATTGLTVAQYARDGFFALAFASGLVLGVLLTLNALLKDDRLGAWNVSRRLSGSLLAMVGLVMVSAVARMSLYVESFGISVDRIVALAIMAWLAMVSGWFVLTVLRERASRFVIGAMVAGSATLVALNAINPEAIAMRSQLARYARTGELDAEYVQRLGSDAVPAMVQALASGSVPRSSATCGLVRSLLPPSKVGAFERVSSWTVSEARAAWNVSRNGDALWAHCELSR